MRWFATLVLLSLTTASSAVAGGVADTWAKRTDASPAGVTPPVPVVIYVHGCSGAYARPELTMDTKAWEAAITAAGWRFVVPDSWARGVWSRPDGCRLGSVGSALKLQTMRVEEIAYAITRLREDPTADATRIVAFGHSEGGWVLATSEAPAGLKAEIIGGWTCHASVKVLTGLVPIVPLLAIEFDRDSFLSTQGRCSEFFGSRTDAREVILPGSGHNAGSVEAARQAVAEFLHRMVAP